MLNHFPILQPGSRVCICGHPDHVHPMHVEQDMCLPDPTTRYRSALDELKSAGRDLEGQVVELERIVSAIATAFDSLGGAGLLHDLVRSEPALSAGVDLALAYMARIEGGA